MMPFAATTLCAAVLLSAPPVILEEGHVDQYRMAADGAKRHLPGALEVSLADVGTADALASAPIVVAVGRRALALARQKVPETIPIVFSMVLGVSDHDLARNVTGVPLEVDPVEILKGIRAISPKLRRVGVIYNPRATGLLVGSARKAASGLGLSLAVKEVSAPQEVRDAVEGMLGSIDVLWLPPDPKLFSKELFTFMLSFSAERRLPLIGFLDAFTRAGALASFSPDYAQIGERAGELAQRILGEAQEKRLPVPGLVFAQGNLSLNLVSAVALGVEVPDSVVSTAKQVYR